MSTAIEFKRIVRSATMTSGILAILAGFAYLLGRIDESQSRPVGRSARFLNEGLTSAGGDQSPEALLEPGHGRMATTPSEFGKRAWKDILVRTYHETIEDRITTVAAGVALFGLLAIFPAIAALVSLYGLVADPATIRDHLFKLAFLLPPNAFAIVEDQIKRVVSQGGGDLSLKFAFGLCLSVWSANAAMKAILDGLNVAYEEEEKRSFLRLNAISLTMTVFALVGLLGIIAGTAILPSIAQDVGPASLAATISTYLRWPLMLTVIALGISLLYRFGPSRAQPKWRWVSWGSAVAAMAIVIVSVLLNWYLTKFADYNKTYGSLGAVIGLITWLWLAVCAVLVGGELNGEMEHQTARDSTTGPAKPMGLRGAKMADTLGYSSD